MALSKVKERVTKMKKMILTMVAALTMTTAMAANEPIQGNETNAYELNVNMNKLSETLKLTVGQQYVVEDIMDTFSKDMKKAGEADELYRSALVKEATHKAIKELRYVLDGNQMRTYLRVLNSTMNNRGLNK